MLCVVHWAAARGWKQLDRRKDYEGMLLIERYFSVREADSQWRDACIVQPGASELFEVLMQSWS